MADLGRPTVMTQKTLQKLEGAFLNGANDKEAIFLADISSSTFYDYCKQNVDFSEKIEGLKNMPKYKAKKNIIEAINEGDVQVSQWFAERKIKEDFSLRSELTGANGSELKTITVVKNYGSNDQSTPETN